MNAWFGVRRERVPWGVHGTFALLLVLAVAGAAGEGRVLAGVGGLLLGVIYAAGVVPFGAGSGPVWAGLAAVTLGWGMLATTSAWYVLPAVPLVFAWMRLVPLWAAVFGVTLLGCASVLAVSRQAGGVSAPAVFGPLAVTALVALAGAAWRGEEQAYEPEAAARRPAVRRSSLVSAVRRLSEATAARARIPVRFGVSGTPAELPPAHDMVLLRVARGALGNVGRHSGARNAGVTLTYLDGLIMLNVSDDGRGFDPYTTTGRDLRDLRERVEALGGTLTVRSAPGGGTAVVAGLPR
ncbi:sensor histidine kinase [Nonomuraea sp. NPDC047897]|uniref:sensor histidine kinase n=1 Tax=Nonomuraea sp. NPDC047897 TaxID=3364346 RepID=UPI00371A6A06